MRQCVCVDAGWVGECLCEGVDAGAEVCGLAVVLGALVTAPAEADACSAALADGEPLALADGAIEAKKRGIGMTPLTIAA